MARLSLNRTKSRWVQAPGRIGSLRVPAGAIPRNLRRPPLSPRRKVPPSVSLLPAAQRKIPRRLRSKAGSSVPVLSAVLNRTPRQRRPVDAPMRFSDRGGTERRNALCNGLAGSEILAQRKPPASRPARSWLPHKQRVRHHLLRKIDPQVPGQARYRGARRAQFGVLFVDLTVHESAAA